MVEIGTSSIVNNHGQAAGAAEGVDYTEESFIAANVN